VCGRQRQQHEWAGSVGRRPARVVGETGCDRPSRQMDQFLPSQAMDHVVSFDI